MWAYDFMLRALVSGVIVALVCGLISVFVVLRRTAFAAHALSHMSLTGAAAAGLLALPLIIGQLVFNIIAAIIMGILGDKIHKNDLAVGVVLTFFLGLGAYLLYLYQNNYAGSIFAVLFGNVFATTITQIYWLLGLALLVILILGIVLRPLLLASIDPMIAQSKNISLSALSVIFFVLLAVTVSMACQIVGVLLVFVLLIIPGAIATQWGENLWSIILLSVTSSISAYVLALCAAYQFDLPLSFCLTMLLCVVYFVGLLIKNKYLINYLTNVLSKQ